MKKIYNSSRSFQYHDTSGKLRAAYFPELPMDQLVPNFLEELEKIPFTRVEYISRFGKKNRTPRKTWAYGRVDSDVVSYSKHGQTLNFVSEEMPKFLKRLADYCRKISIRKWGFDPLYNSVIIGKYEGRDDHIGFHFDTETFLAHHFCANVTIGYARDFQFRNEGQTHQVALANNSVLFFDGLEHALPKRAAVKEGDVRYSISFRNMNKDIGIANSFYYCRGLAGAIDDDHKEKYNEKMKEL